MTTPPETPIPVPPHRLSSPLLTPYLRLTIVHGDPADQDEDARMRAALRRIRDALDPWWLRTIGTNDRTMLDLAATVDVALIARVLAEHAPLTWPCSLGRCV